LSANILIAFGLPTDESDSRSPTSQTAAWLAQIGYQYVLVESDFAEYVEVLDLPRL